MKDSLKEFAGLVRDYVFDAYYPSEGGTGRIRSAVASLAGEEVAEGFMEDLPCIRQSLHRDVEAIRHADPAVSDVSEVILCYPGIFGCHANQLVVLQQLFGILGATHAHAAFSKA